MMERVIGIMKSELLLERNPLMQKLASLSIYHAQSCSPEPATANLKQRQPFL